jgi:hypothetical protein
MDFAEGLERQGSAIRPRASNLNREHQSPLPLIAALLQDRKRSCSIVRMRSAAMRNLCPDTNRRAGAFG